MDQDIFSIPPGLRSSLLEKAYSLVRDKQAGLVDAYERVLSAQLGNSIPYYTNLASQTNDIEQDDIAKRQSQFKQIAEDGFARVQAKAWTLYGSEKDDERTGLLSEIIGKALVAIDEAAIPWVGICVGLEILLDSSFGEGLPRHGLARLISRMDCYWNLPVLLSDPNQGLTEELRCDITSLYKKTLSWQMEMICFTFRQEDASFLLNSPQIHDWDGNGANFMRDETNILDALAGESANWEGLRHLRLRGLGRVVMSTEIRLRNIHSKTHVFVCEVCGNLDPDIWGDHDFWYRHSRRYRYLDVYLLDVRDSSSRCAACDIVFGGFSQIVEPLGPLDMHVRLSLLIGRENFPLKLEYHSALPIYSADGPEMLEFFVPQGLPKPWPALGNAHMLKDATSTPTC